MFRSTFSLTLPARHLIFLETRSVFVLCRVPLPAYFLSVFVCAAYTASVLSWSVVPRSMLSILTLRTMPPLNPPIGAERQGAKRRLFFLTVLLCFIPFSSCCCFILL